MYVIANVLHAAFQSPCSPIFTYCTGLGIGTIKNTQRGSGATLGIYLSI